jgi:hypothetical protein
MPTEVYNNSLRTSRIRERVLTVGRHKQGNPVSASLFFVLFIFSVIVICCVVRSKFVAAGSSIHFYVVEFSPEQLSWSDFRGKVLGPTDPASAPEDSLRGAMYNKWESLGLAFQPNVGENCVHASASPFEGLAERMNWLKAPVEEDSFGAQLVAAGITVDTIKAWSVDPQVKGKSVFDQLEDLDVSECKAKLCELADL